MMTQLTCPHCDSPLSEAELKRLWAQFCGRKTSTAKRKAAAENGRKGGGRPMTYMQTIYESIPQCVEPLHHKLKAWNTEYLFDVVLQKEADPSANGFYLQCEDIVWHCVFNPATDYLDIFENGAKCGGLWRVNYSAKVASKKLVEDIHRMKLMRMPPDYSKQIKWIESRTGKPFNIKDVMSDAE